LVAVLTTLIATPGTVALVESVTVPVIMPRSDCAKDRLGMPQASTISRIVNVRLIMLPPSPTGFLELRNKKPQMNDFT
jgi:hypothetical protein